MKKIILTAAAVFVFGFANAQENIIKANPLSILGGTDLLSFEHKIGDHTSAVLGLGYGGFSIGGAKYTNMGAELQYRYYFNEALKGFYGGGQIGYSFGKVTMDDFLGGASEDIKFSAIKVGAKGGYQWVWDSGFSLDLNLGLAFNNFKYADSTNSVGLKASGVLPNFGFGLGYAF
jgi:hypothetical protein